jgi:ribose transport system substrate-binding protein
MRDSSRFVRLAGATAAVLTVAACSNAPAGSTGATSAATGSGGVTMTVAQELAGVGTTSSTAFCGKKKIKLGVQDGFGVNAWSQASMAAVRSEAARCPNVTTVVQIGEGSLQTSISQINSMVAQQINALVVIPDFGQSELPTLRAATKAGVKVVPWAADPSGTPGQDYVSYVDWSSPNAGTLWAQWMVTALKGKGNVVFIGGPAGNPVTAGQLASVVKVIGANPGMKLLTGTKSWPVTNWDPATAQQVMSSLLAKYPKIDGIISDYGTDALAATRAFTAASRSLVPIATLDANGLGCLYQQNKTNQPNFQLATISSRNWLGRIAARKAIAAAAGVPDNEPSTFDLPLIENSLTSPSPVCVSSAPQDFYNSNRLTVAQLTEYGKP